MDARKTSPTAGARWQDMHWTTQVGVLAVILCVIVVITLNVVGWLNTLPGFPGWAFATIAASFELMAFVLLEHIFKYRAERDWGRVLLAVLGLAFAVTINVEGGHRGVNHVLAPLWAQVESDRRASQDALDAERAELQGAIAERQARVDAVAATNPGVTYPGRMAEWRANFDLVTHEDRAQISSATARLDALPVAVAAREPYPWWAPYVGSTFLAFFSVFGLTMFAVKVPGLQQRVAKRPPPRPKPKPAPEPKREAPALHVVPDDPKPAPKKHGLGANAGALLRTAAAAGLAATLPGLPAPAHASPLVTFDGARLGPDRSPNGSPAGAFVRPQPGRPANIADTPRDRCRAMLRDGVSAKQAARVTGVPYTTAKKDKRRLQGLPA